MALKDELKDSISEAKRAKAMKDEMIERYQNSINGRLIMTFVALVLAVWSILSFFYESLDFWFVGKWTLILSIIVSIFQFVKIANESEELEKVKKMSITQFRHIYL